MFILSKLVGIAVLIWFYFSAKENNAPKVKWSIIGLMGYWITWGCVFLTLGDIFSSTGVGFAVAYFVRKKLLNDVQKAAMA